MELELGIFQKNASVGCQLGLRMGKDKSRDGKIYLSFVVAIPWENFRNKGTYTLETFSNRCFFIFIFHVILSEFWKTINFCWQFFSKSFFWPPRKNFKNLDFDKNSLIFFKRNFFLDFERCWLQKLTKLVRTSLSLF